MADIGPCVFGHVMCPYLEGSLNFQTLVIDSTGGSADKVAWGFQMPEAATITHLGFRYGVRAGTPVQHKISLQGLSTTAEGPDGTILGGGSPASGLFTPPADTSWNGLWQWIALDNSIALTRGQFVSIVIEPVGSANSTNKSSFTTYMGSTVARQMFPLTYTSTNGASYAVVKEGPGVFGLKSASKVYGFPIQDFDDSTTITNATTPDEIAYRVKMPVGFPDFQILGLEVGMGSVPNATKTIKMILYDENTNNLQETTIDSDILVNGASGRFAYFYFATATLATCQANKVYRVALQPQDGSTNLAIATFKVASNADLAAFPLGIECYHSERTDAGAWTDTNTRRWHAALILKDFSYGARGQTMRVGGAQNIGML